MGEDSKCKAPVEDHMEGRAPAGDDPECRLHAGGVAASRLAGCEDFALLVFAVWVQTSQSWTLEN